MSEPTNHVGVLPPNGEFISCEPYEHLDLAQELVDKMNNVSPEIKCNRMECEVYLQQLGYIIVRSHDVYGLIGYLVEEKILHLTDEQKKWLIDNYKSFPSDKQKSVDDLIDNKNR